MDPVTLIDSGLSIFAASFRVEDEEEEDLEIEDEETFYS